MINSTHRPRKYQYKVKPLVQGRTDPNYSGCQETKQTHPQH